MLVYWLIIYSAVNVGGAFLKLKTKLVPDSTVEEVNKQIQDNLVEKEQFLGDMEAIESNSGENTDHPTMREGIHKGQSAQGSLGLMPNTINEMAGRLKREGAEPVEIHELRIQNKLPKDTSKLVMGNPKLEKIIADRLYEHVKHKYNGDKEKQNWAWENGHNTPSASITIEKLENSPRTEKFRKLHKRLSNGND